MSKEQVVKELHKDVRKHFKRRPVIMKGIDDLFQADLVEMIPYANQNNNFKYVLMVIDTFSKYLWAVPVKSKSGKNVTSAMESIFKKDGRIPKNLQTDDGKEFFNQNFRKLMNTNNINHYATYSSLKASIVERVNRTIKKKMWMHFSLLGAYKWISILPSLIETYNNTKHSTIKMKPVEVSKNNEKLLLQSVYRDRNRKKYIKGKFKVGEFVRISKYKNIFEKSYTANWTTEIFQITKNQMTNPVTYLLKDQLGTPIKGGFYEFELQKVKYKDIYLVEKVLRQKGNQQYVKWLGLDKSHNSWINKDDFI